MGGTVFPVTHKNTVPCNSVTDYKYVYFISDLDLTALNYIILRKRCLEMVSELFLASKGQFLAVVLAQKAD